MKGKRFTEEKIISILKEHESGIKVPDLLRKHNVRPTGPGDSPVAAGTSGRAGSLRH